MLQGSFAGKGRNLAPALGGLAPLQPPHLCVLGPQLPSNTAASCGGVSRRKQRNSLGKEASGLASSLSPASNFLGAPSDA